MVKLDGFNRTLTAHLASVKRSMVTASPSVHHIRRCGSRVAAAVRLSLASHVTIGVLPLGSVGRIVITVGSDVNSSVLTISLLGRTNIADLATITADVVRGAVLRDLNVASVVVPRACTTSLCTVTSRSPRVGNVCPLASGSFVVRCRVPSLCRKLAVRGSTVRRACGLGIIAIGHTMARGGVVNAGARSCSVISVGASFGFRTNSHVILLNSVSGVGGFGQRG